MAQAGVTGIDMTMHHIHPKAREAQEQYIAELGIADTGHVAVTVITGTHYGDSGAEEEVL